METADILKLTTSIVAAHVENNTVPLNDLPALIAGVHDALRGLGEPPAVPEPAQAPAVSIRASVKPEAITCLECGQKQRTLKRHLGSAHGLTPDLYRTKWNLPASYPMVAPAYSAQRSEMAKAVGLGRKPGQKFAKRAKLGIR